MNILYHDECVNGLVVSTPLSPGASARLAEPLIHMPLYYIINQRHDGSYFGQIIDDVASAANASLGELIASIRVAHFKNDIPYFARTDEGGRLILVHMGGPSPTYIFRGRDAHVATLTDVGQVLALPTPVAPIPSTLIFVPFDIPVFHIQATLFRKENKGSFEMYEDIILPAGVYASIDELADALNAAIQLFGERNGPIYFFMRSKKRPVLRLCAHHRQPHPSCVTISPVEGTIGSLGLQYPANLVLGNKKYIDFHTIPKAIVSM